MSKNRFFEELLESVTQMDEIIRGERVPAREFHVDALGVKAIREITGARAAQVRESAGW